MKFTSTRQLKDWIKNKSNASGTPANTLLQTYMMERLLERISISLSDSLSEIAWVFESFRYEYT